MEQSYTASDTEVLTGLDPVRKRPGMYIGDTGSRGLHHCLWEIIDNSVDEAMAGYGDTIRVTIHEDGSVEVSDKGRGMPVDKYTKGEYNGVPAIEVLFTVLHAGGKFGGSAYQFSGGLHGVGSSVVNALSRFMNAESRRDGKIHRIEMGVNQREVYGEMKTVYGDVISPLTVIGKTDSDDTGTTVHFLPDPEVFKGTKLNTNTIRNRIVQYAYLNQGVHFFFHDKRVEDSEVEEYYFENGLLDMMADKAVERTGVESRADLMTDYFMPAGEPIRFGGQRADGTAEWDMIFRWYGDTAYEVSSFANGIYTGGGGTHVSGYESQLTRLFNRFANEAELLSGNQKLEARDVRSGLGVIISVKTREAQFVGQTKDELSNPEVKQMVSSGFSEQFWDWMMENTSEARRFVEKAVREMQLRRKLEADEAKAREGGDEPRGLAVTEKSISKSHKLSDCDVEGEEAEIFLVEGDSAGGTSIKARDQRFQAVLPIRGKGLNVEKASDDRIEANAELQGFYGTLGCGTRDNFDISKLRYHKIILMADADIDGAHIANLLLTAIWRLTPDLIRNGHVYVCEPPLYMDKLDGKPIYMRTMAQRIALEQYTGRDFAGTRYKGLGTMEFEELRATCMNPDTRKLRQVIVDEGSEFDVDNIIVALMGSNASQRAAIVAENRVESLSEIG